MFRKIVSICLVLGFLLAAALLANPVPNAKAALPAAGETATPTAGPKPDLVITSVVGQQTVLDANGCALSRINTLLVTIQNIGPAAAGVFEVSATGRNKMHQAVPKLAAGASITLTFADLPTDGVNVITVDSTGLVAESQEGNNATTYNSPTPPAMCTATPTPIGFKSPTKTSTGTQPCTTSGQVVYDHTGGAGMVNVPLVMANTTGTPNPLVVATTGPYGQYKAGCLMGKTIYAQLSPFTFNPTSVYGGGAFGSSYSPVGIAFGVPTYTPTGNIPTLTPTITRTPTPVTTNDLLPDLTILSMASTASTPACANQPYVAVVVKNIGSGAAGAFSVSFNANVQAVSGLAAGQQLTLSFPLSSVIGGTNTSTADSAAVIAELNESNNSLSGLIGVPGAGPTCTPTGGASPTRTPTMVITPPTITRTPTITPTSGVGTCSPVTATIAAPFTQDGVGTFCWQSTNLGNYINSWNLTSLTVNGVNVTNTYVAAGSLPAKINGFWYISYNSTVAWGHFEAK